MNKYDMGYRYDMKRIWQSLKIRRHGVALNNTYLTAKERMHI